jgi:hypothetical protein
MHDTAEQREHRQASEPGGDRGHSTGWLATNIILRSRAVVRARGETLARVSTRRRRPESPRRRICPRAAVRWHSEPRNDTRIVREREPGVGEEVSFRINIFFCYVERRSESHAGSSRVIVGRELHRVTIQATDGDRRVRSGHTPSIATPIAFRAASATG